MPGLEWVPRRLTQPGAALTLAYLREDPLALAPQALPFPHSQPLPLHDNQGTRSDTGSSPRGRWIYTKTCSVDLPLAVRVENKSQALTPKWLLIYLEKQTNDE